MWAIFWRLCVVGSYSHTVRYLNCVSGEQGSRGGLIELMNIKRYINVGSETGVSHVSVTLITFIVLRLERIHSRFVSILCTRKSVRSSSIVHECTMDRNEDYLESYCS